MLFKGGAVWEMGGLRFLIKVHFSKFEADAFYFFAAELFSIKIAYL